MNKYVDISGLKDYKTGLEREAERIDSIFNTINDLVKGLSGYAIQGQVEGEIGQLSSQMTKDCNEFKEIVTNMTTFLDKYISETESQDVEHRGQLDNKNEENAQKGFEQPRQGGGGGGMPSGGGGQSGSGKPKEEKKDGNNNKRDSKSQQQCPQQSQMPRCNSPMSRPQQRPNSNLPNRKNDDLYQKPYPNNNQGNNGKSNVIPSGGTGSGGGGGMPYYGVNQPQQQPLNPSYDNKFKDLKHDFGGKDLDSLKTELPNSEETDETQGLDFLNSGEATTEPVLDNLSTTPEISPSIEPTVPVKKDNSALKTAGLVGLGLGAATLGVAAAVTAKKKNEDQVVYTDEEAVGDNSFGNDFMNNNDYNQDVDW